MGPTYTIAGAMAVLVGICGVLIGAQYLIWVWQARRARRLCWHCEARRSSGRPGAKGRCDRCLKRWRSARAKVAGDIEASIGEER